jgi:two-component sensor histidine kinase
VDLAKHARLLLSNLFHAYGVDASRLSSRVLMPPLVLGVDQAIPAGLILNELVSNALKHAFPHGLFGSIVIEGCVDGNAAEHRVQLAVRDDGVGLPENFRPEQTRSLGLRIVQILARQLKGTFDFERAGGSIFRVSFPLNPSVS